VFGFAEKVTVLPLLTNPATLAVDESQFYISEGATVFIFSLKDYKIKAKFGKAGIGPKEFNLGLQRRLSLTVLKDKLVINSTNKVSFYTKDGKFINEYKTFRQLSFFYKPFGDQYIGIHTNRKQSNSPSIQFVLSIFNPNFKIIKSIAKFDFLKKGNLQFPVVFPICKVYRKKILALSGKKFELSIFNAKGDLVSTIYRDYQPIKVLDDYKKGIHYYLKRTIGANYAMIENMIKFDNYFPAIRNFYVTGNKIYILTYLKKDEKIECFIYDTNWKFYKKVFLPIYMKNPIRFYPFSIRQNKLFQLTENNDEVWEFHVTKIE